MNTAIEQMRRAIRLTRDAAPRARAQVKALTSGSGSSLGGTVLYGTATGANTVAVGGSTIAMTHPAIVDVTTGDFVAVWVAGKDRFILGPVGSSVVRSQGGSYAPATGGGTGITLGTGGVITVDWLFTGGPNVGDVGLLHMNTRLVFGTSGAVAAGTGSVIALPPGIRWVPNALNANFGMARHFSTVGDIGCYWTVNNSTVYLMMLYQTGDTAPNSVYQGHLGARYPAPNNEGFIWTGSALAVRV